MTKSVNIIVQVFCEHMPFYLLYKPLGLKLLSHSVVLQETAKVVVQFHPLSSIPQQLIGVLVFSHSCQHLVCVCLFNFTLSSWMVLVSHGGFNLYYADN